MSVFSNKYSAAREEAGDYTKASELQYGRIPQLEQQIRDMEVYRRLFWNPTLSPDELCLFGEKLAKEFPDIAYDTYLWLATVFEATHSVFDNHELAFTSFQKAAAARPEMLDPYLDAANCYERDLNIPPSGALINWRAT